VIVATGKWTWAALVAVMVATACGAVQAAAAPAVAPETFGATEITPFAKLALTCVHQQYPNHLSHTLASDADAKPPRELTPAFYGCLDWHSAVHAHWLLARVARLYPDAPFAAQARAALAQSLTPANIAGEVAYLSAAGRASFERPYGLAWLLQLSAELHAWQDPQARQWAAALEPLERVAVQKTSTWLPNLHYPIRIGEHSQTAFGLGLMLDWARARHDEAFAALIERKAREFYLGDRSCPLRYEPSGEDFLSPCLGEADLMRRVLGAPQFAAWLKVFLPQVGGRNWLPPAIVTDRSDPKLAHLDGLNLSRAWMLEGMASGLPRLDPRVAQLQATARAHRAEALPGITGQYYEGAHWLGTFATYLTTGAGLSAPH
jgi:hypothetical protein